MIDWEPWYLIIPLVERQRIETLPPKERRVALSRHYWNYVEKNRQAKQAKKPLDNQLTMFENPGMRMLPPGPSDPDMIPTWVRKALDNNWDLILANVPPDLLPYRLQTSNLLGCGHYGCVFDTLSPDWVFKITSDPTEAEFVKKAIELAKQDGYWPTGIVQYAGIIELEGTHRKRPIHALWRQSATNVEEFYAVSNDPYEIRNMRESQSALMLYKDLATIVRTGFKGVGLKRLKEGPVKEIAPLMPEYDQQSGDLRYAISKMTGIAKYATAYHYLAQLPLYMENMNPVVTYIGNALNYYLEKDIILADVHTGNLGKVTHPEYSEPIWVITDPGHAFGNL